MREILFRLPLDYISWIILSQTSREVYSPTRASASFWRTLTNSAPAFIQLHHTRSRTRPKQWPPPTHGPFFSASESINGLICLGLHDDDCVALLHTYEALSPLHWTIARRSRPSILPPTPTNPENMRTRAVSPAHEIFTQGSKIQWRFLNDDIPPGYRGVLTWDREFRESLETPEYAPPKFMSNTSLTHIGVGLALVGHASLVFRNEVRYKDSEEGRSNELTWVNHIRDASSTPDGSLALIQRMETVLGGLYWEPRNKLLGKKRINATSLLGICSLAYVTCHVESPQSYGNLWPRNSPFICVIQYCKIFTSLSPYLTLRVSEFDNDFKKNFNLVILRKF
ncbi:hypothetical protein PVL29_006283 [Vitis rotundifolia]|uniref:Uncharacterized protein n=1 Tax=Vitis rotundifolia TaxID=103349 RepID=A0AA39A4M2_VITRO|nr:hypothetical protein PVL29_006283 [Vitis rotundifolia]